MTGNGPKGGARPAPNASAPRGESTAIAPLDAKIQEVGAYLRKRQDQIGMALPRGGLTPERVVRIVMTEVRRNPDLVNCSPISFLGAILTCSAVGLEIGAHLGHAYLVPYKSKNSSAKVCTPIFGYRGLITLARRSGEIDTLEAHVVREGDSFVYRYGSDQTLQHVPSHAFTMGKDPKGRPVPVLPPVTHGWAMTRFRGGSSPLFEVMSEAEIRLIEQRSGGGDAWRTDWSEMARKTLVRRICKYLPLTSEAAAAIEISEAAEVRGERPGYIPDLDFIAEDEAKAEREARERGEIVDAPALEERSSASTLHDDLGREEEGDPDAGEREPTDAELAELAREHATVTRGR